MQGFVGVQQDLRVLMDVDRRRVLRQQNAKFRQPFIAEFLHVVRKAGEQIPNCLSAYDQHRNSELLHQFDQALQNPERLVALQPSKHLELVEHQ